MSFKNILVCKSLPDSDMGFRPYVVYDVQGRFDPFLLHQAEKFAKRMDIKIFISRDVDVDIPGCERVAHI
jgi:hypothetical protein